jgi:ferredoxin
MFKATILERVLDGVNKKDIITCPELCPSVKSPKSTCCRCLDYCPAGSIKIKDTILLDDNCSECGICISACPNGVFNSRHKNDAYILSRAYNLFHRDPGEPVRFSCEKSSEKDDDTIILPCIGRLTENMLIDLVLQGAMIEIKLPDCAGCGFEKVKTLFTETMQVALLILKAVGGEGEGIRILGEFKKRNMQTSAGTGLNRRSFIKKIKNMVLIKTSETFSDFIKLEQKHGAAGHVNKVQNYKRTQLVNLLKKLNNKETVLCANTFVPFATSYINESCIGCDVCSAICPEGAIQKVSGDDFIKILFSEQHCTNCALCQNACLVGAIKVTPRIFLKRILDDGKITLIELRKKKCLFCNEEFAAINKTICPLCENKTHDWAGKGRKY